MRYTSHEGSVACHECAVHCAVLLPDAPLRVVLYCLTEQHLNVMCNTIDVHVRAPHDLHGIHVMNS
ncbi:hypothetical protein MTQ10_22240 [Streptomyces sp. XM83C]|jgi:hypothetical protein|nr:hypothetical protein [Streptomyces sp. XM83C]MCK1822252.1 hypothetical protein [Streptomyces sp. XM83C]